ncbi:MAG TPA: homoserine dehydrogenase [Gemmatimonadaceae bacterium]
MAPPIVRLGLIGCGTVGSAFAEQLLLREPLLARQLGARLHLARVAVRDTTRQRPVPRTALTDDAADIASDPDIDVVIEASGASQAAEWLRSALGRGATVVTASKQAVARTPALLERLVRRDQRLWCEGAVAAGVPVVRALRESLAGEEVHSIRGVLNGTSTFLLTRLEAGSTLDAALADARSLGYTEADPTADLDGSDAAAKIAILCTVAWRTPVLADHVTVTGIAGVLPVAREGRWRLVATATRDGDHIRATVRPERLEAGDPLASAHGVVNVVEVKAALAGALTWSGAGAGGAATASALVGDTLSAARQALRRLRAKAAA